MVPNGCVSNQASGHRNLATGHGDQNNNNGTGNQIILEINGDNAQSSQTQAQADHDEKEECLKSLAISRIHNRLDAIHEALPRTCDWLFNATQFLIWWRLEQLSIHNGVLWIKGKPGVGKSTLMKHAFRWCQNRCPESHLIVGHFFNAEGRLHEKALSGILGLLRSIISQLIRANDAIYEKFRLIFQRQNMCEPKGWVWDISTLKGFIFSLIQEKGTKPLIILIDALDECTKDTVLKVVDFLEILSGMAVHSGYDLKICLSSRHYPTIRMKKMLELTIEESPNHHEDIFIYIKERLKFEDEHFLQKVKTKADGIFTWAVIVVSILNKEIDKGYLEKLGTILDKIPKKLEAVFTKVLDEDRTIDPETVLMFQWVLFSLKPLRPKELFFATLAGTDPQYAELQADSKFTRDDIKRRIITASKGLIEVRNDSSEDPQNECVQFIHLSVKDFLLRDERLQSLDKTLSPDPIRLSHRRLWKICWSCIYNFHTRYPVCELDHEISDSSDAEPEFLFLRYAKTYIFNHADRGIFEEGMTPKPGRLKRLISWGKGIYEHSLEEWLYKHKEWYGDWKATPGYPEHRLSGFVAKVDGSEGIAYTMLTSGCSRVLRAILIKGHADPNEQGGYYGNALQAASYTGNHDAVKLLLETGADVHAQGGEYGTALTAASVSSNFEIVKLLLEAGANVNSQGGYYGNVLQAASCVGNAEMVTLLLDAGANVNAEGGHCGSPLQAASVNGNKDVVRLLLKSGGDVNMQGGHLGNSLQGASYAGNEEVVRLLLEVGADVNARGAGFYGTALAAASASSNIEIVKLLLEAGADVNAKGGHYGDSLQGASRAGNRETVKLLLKAGADVHAQGGSYGNALPGAALNGDKEVVRLLLEAGADPNVQGGYYGNSLQGASYTGNFEAVRLLLEAGANVHAQGGEYGTALEAACFNRTKEIVSLLLEAKANVNAQGGHYGNPLQGASYAGNPEIVRLLLEAGATVNAQGGCFGNALRAALATRNNEIVGILVDAGAAYERADSESELSDAH